MDFAIKSSSSFFLLKSFLNPHTRFSKKKKLEKEKLKKKKLEKNNKYPPNPMTILHLKGNLQLNNFSLLYVIGMNHGTKYKLSLSKFNKIIN